jgi:hypothetical protein
MLSKADSTIFLFLKCVARVTLFTKDEFVFSESLDKCMNLTIFLSYAFKMLLVLLVVRECVE